jgi:hypothetical protein
MKVVTPNRVTRTFTQRLAAPPSAVFPLLCPVREAEWMDGWHPVAVFSHSGVAEPDCVFLTDTPPGTAVWYVTRHEPDHGLVEMIKITPGVTACRITIQLRPAGHGCDATVTYAHTSLGPDGDTFVTSFTDERYRAVMRDWESRLNHHLAGGPRRHAGAGSPGSGHPPQPATPGASP